MHLLSNLKGIARRVMGFDAVKPVDATTYGGSSLTTIYDELELPDEILAEHTDEGRAYYPRMRRQIPFLAGICKLRIDAVLSLQQAFVVGDPGEKRSVEMRELALDAWNNIHDRLSAERQLLTAILDGTSLARYEWGAHDSVIVGKETDADGQMRIGRIEETLLIPKRIIDWPLEKWTLNTEGKVRLSDGYRTGGRVLDPFEYVLARYGSARDWGCAEMKEVALDAWKYDQIDKMGLTAMRKQGFPLVVIFYPEHWDVDKREALRVAMAANYPNFMMIPHGDRVEIKDMGPASAPTFIGADQIARISKLEDSMSIALLGVAFSNSETGARARDQVRNELRFEKTAGDAAVRDAIANDWLQKVCVVNFPDVPRSWWPRAVTDVSPTEDLDSWAKNLAAVVSIGVTASASQIRERLGISEPESEADAIGAAVAPVADVAATDPEADETVAPPELEAVPAAGLPDAGIADVSSLTAGQITGVLTALEAFRKGSIGPEAARIIIKGSGITDAEADLMVKEAGNLEEPAPTTISTTFLPAPVPDPLTIMSETGTLYEMGEFDEQTQSIRLRLKE